MRTEHDKTRRAAEAMAARMGFFVHLAIYALVVIVLTLVNMITAPNEFWVQWVALGWGAGVALHAVLVFGRWPRRVQAWHLRKIRSLREQL
jgi:hypothetical protein